MMKSAGGEIAVRQSESERRMDGWWLQQQFCEWNWMASGSSGKGNGMKVWMKRVRLFSLLVLFQGSERGLLDFWPMYELIRDRLRRWSEYGSLLSYGMVCWKFAIWSQTRLTWFFHLCIFINLVV